jgi:hypothetical protein
VDCPYDTRFESWLLNNLLPPGPKEDRLTGIIKALSLGENKLNMAKRQITFREDWRKDHPEEGGLTEIHFSPIRKHKPINSGDTVTFIYKTKENYGKRKSKNSA